MGKIITQEIRRFDKGISNDPRVEDTRFSQMIANFDAHSYPYKLTPLTETESGDGAASTSQKQNFAIALRTGTIYSLYALGVKSGANTAEVLYKDINIASATDLDDSDWATPSANQSSTGSTNFNLFVYYRRTGLIYGARAGTNIWAFSPTGTAWADTSQALTYTSIGQGLVHSKDDILYIPYYNNAGASGAKSFIAKNNNGSWTVTALTLPDHLVPVSICEYGNYLAIGCQPASGIGASRVYLWDRDSSLTTVSESIDWGEGNLQVLEEVNGVLIGISYRGTNATALESKIIFRAYTGNKPVVFQELISETTFTSGDLPIFKQKVNDNLFFMLRIKLGGTTLQGVWKLGIPHGGQGFSISLDRFLNNDTAIPTSTTFGGFFVVGDYMFISWNSAGTTWVLSKTNGGTINTSNYDVSAIYESLKFRPPEGKSGKLLVAGVLTEPMPYNSGASFGGQIILKYKKDGETTWTTIYTQTVDDTNDADYLSLYHESINIESSEASLPQFKEIQFQILSTGKAVVTGLKFKYEIIEDTLIT